MVGIYWRTVFLANLRSNAEKCEENKFYVNFNDTREAYQRSMNYINFMLILMMHEQWSVNLYFQKKQHINLNVGGLLISLNTSL